VTCRCGTAGVKDDQALKNSVHTQSKNHGLRLVQGDEDQDFLIRGEKTAITQASLISRARQHNAKKFWASGMYASPNRKEAIRCMTNRANQTWVN